MKNIILIMLINLAVIADIKVKTLETKRVDYQNGNITATIFRIVCINGYKWLQYDGMHGSISQMFIEVNNQPRLIKCEN